jgi:membrane complex biogenesis BtpA family protein
MLYVDLFPHKPALIGVVHLLPLPGSPQYDGDWEAVGARALADARALAEGGVDGLIVENFHDVPFAKDRVGPHTVAAMALLVQEVRRAVTVPVGVNVLRNDARAALAIAAVCGAAFIRVNVHVGAMVTDQGIIEGRADETLRYRRELGARVAIFADVLVKHAAPLGSVDLAQVAHDTARRGLADALIVSGAATGQPCDPDDLQAVRLRVEDVPLLIGSGVHEGNAAALLALADGAIVGTSLKRGGDVHQPVDAARVRALRAALGR